MPFKSIYADLDIPQSNLLDFTFPAGSTPSDRPLWIDSKDTSVSLSAAQTLEWVKRLGFGLQRAGIKKGEVVMIFTPNHVFVPVAYLGIVGAGHSFSAGNPAYTIPGSYPFPMDLLFAMPEKMLTGPQRSSTS